MPNEINKSITDLYPYLLNYKYPCQYADLGGMSLLCHTSSQLGHLKEMINSILPFVNEVVILDNDSNDGTTQWCIDQGYKVVHIPLGWIYTHGFSELEMLGINMCDPKNDWVFSLNSDFRIYIPEDQKKLDTSCSVYNTFMLNKRSADGVVERFVQACRIINRKHRVPIVGMIHQGIDPQLKLKYGDSNIYLLHDNFKTYLNSPGYQERRDRLMYKLFHRAYELKAMNTHWMKHFEQHGKDYIRVYKAMEDLIGILETTDESYKVLSNGTKFSRPTT